MYPQLKRKSFRGVGRYCKSGENYTLIIIPLFHPDFYENIEGRFYFCLKISENIGSRAYFVPPALIFKSELFALKSSKNPRFTSAAAQTNANSTDFKP